ncbi:MAG: chemotaxis protein CheW [Burkholderiaceae bacterium]
MLVCRVQTRLCGLPLSDVEETLRPQPLRPLAAPVVHVMGLARIRGRWLPVIDLAGVLGLEDALVQRYVVVRTGERRVVLAVAEVLGLHRLQAADIDRLPPLLQDDRHAAVAALAQRDDELMAVLDHARLLPDTAGLPHPESEATP